jgi:hypothetical protein
LRTSFRNEGLYPPRAEVACGSIAVELSNAIAPRENEHSSEFQGAALKSLKVQH